MRYGQFKLSEDEIQALRPVVSPTKVEDDVDQNLDIIATAAENAKEENPSIYKKIQSQLEKLQQKAKQLLANQGKEEPVEEDVAVATSATDMSIANIKRIIDAMCGGKPINVCKNPDAMALQKEISALEQSIPEQIKQERGEERTQTIKDLKTFKKELRNKLKLLVKKAEGLTPESQLDKTNMSAVQKSILNHMTAIINTVEDRDISPETINKFLDYAIAGQVIDMKGLVAAKKGKIDDHINQKLDQDVKELFDEEIKTAFFGFIPGGTTSGNYGPAEVGLAILGNPAKKADDRGDLIVDGVAFELKGSGYNSKQMTPGSLYGARLNSKGIGAGTAGWQELNKQVKRINPKIKEINPNDEKGAMKEPGYMSAFNVMTSKGKVSKKLSSRYNFNTSGLKVLNNEVLIPNSKRKSPGEGIKDTVQLLDATFKSIINGWKKVDNWNKRIKAMVDSDGSIDVNKFQLHYSALAYDSYNKEDEVENILFVNSMNRNYYLIGNQAELIKAVKSGDVMIKGGITWNDDQQKATPQYARA
jgi:hypothetical protein